ncbi:unnamed protein product [Mytilus edulis]|uniref:Uncharacterized protein n=1 Tax=Mytilus edulis TaxID=6550 RepID=A0A8S3R3T2_MYTED|nr:unnamed protein product [Mytilus edulis]
MQENVNIIKEIASEFQSFMAIRELAQSANTAETDLHHFVENGSLKWTEICYTQTNLDSVKDNLTSIGKTDVKDDPSRIKLKIRKTREAQLMGPVKSSSNIENIHLKEKFRNVLPTGNNDFEILDCGFLLDGKVIFSDRQNKRLIILDSKGVFVRI